jgi:hypothetical protein
MLHEQVGRDRRVLLGAFPQLADPEMPTRTFALSGELAPARRRQAIRGGLEREDPVAGIQRSANRYRGDALERPGAASRQPHLDVSRDQLDDRAAAGHRGRLCT